MKKPQLTKKMKKRYEEAAEKGLLEASEIDIQNPKQHLLGLKVMCDYLNDAYTQCAESLAFENEDDVY